MAQQGWRRSRRGAIKQCSRSGLSDSSSRNSAREEEINFNSHSEIIYDLIFFNGAEGRPESSGKLSRDPMKDSLYSIAEVNYDTTRRAKFYSSPGHHCYNNVDIWPITPLYCGEWWSWNIFRMRNNKLQKLRKIRYMNRKKKKRRVDGRGAIKM